jgi:nucleotide-binding universal stress UspA family protein
MLAKHAALARIAESFALSTTSPATGARGAEAHPADERRRCPATAIRHVLAPLDGSKLAERALPFAAAVAQAWSARLTLVRVLEPAAHTVRAQHVDPVEWEILRGEARRELERIQRDFQQRGLTAELVLLEGRPAEQILRFADEHGVDLIVLSSHGEGGLTGWSLSSTALKLVARAHSSLMIVPAYAAGEHDVGAMRFSRILVPLDCSARSECVLPLVESLARANDAELLLLHVAPEPELPRRMPLSHEDVDLAAQVTERNRSAGERYLHALRDRLASQGVKVEARVVSSARCPRRIRELAEEERIDLVVLSAHGASGDPTERHGRVAARMIHEGTKPTLVVQDLAREVGEASRAEEAAKEHSGH